MMNGRRLHAGPALLLLAAQALLFLYDEPPAYAATPAELATARRLFAEAEEDEEAGRWTEALDKLERVAAVKETAGVRFHIATCHAALGRLVDALDDYQRAELLARDQKATDVLAMVHDRIAEVRERIPVLRLNIPKDVGEVSVTLDGRPVELGSDAAFRLDPGSHHVLVTVSGQDRIDRFVTLSERKSETLDLPSGARPSQAPVATKAPERAPRARGGETVKTVKPASVPGLAWVALGAGAAFGIGGYLAYRKADSVAGESARACALSIACDPARAQVVRRWDATALGLWVGAAAALGTGITLVAVGEPASADHVAVVIAPDTLLLRGGFQ